MKSILSIFVLTSIVLFSGCMNMPTAPNEITGMQVSTLKYESIETPRLISELENLHRRENILVSAQIARHKTSEVQAFWYGYGKGDGVEAAEIAYVRGEKEAIITVLTNRNVVVDIPKKVIIPTEQPDSVRTVVTPRQPGT